MRLDGIERVERSVRWRQENTVFSQRFTRCEVKDLPAKTPIPQQPVHRLKPDDAPMPILFPDKGIRPRVKGSIGRIGIFKEVAIPRIEAQSRLGGIETKAVGKRGQGMDRAGSRAGRDTPC